MMMKFMSGLIAVFTLAGVVYAAPVVLQNATATHSQSVSHYYVNETIDGDFGGRNGWAIGDLFTDHAAVWETASDLNTGTLTFRIYHNYQYDTGNIGRFRISVTTDDRSSFADGLIAGGDVNANWTVLDPVNASSLHGATMTEQADHSIYVSGTNALNERYSITATTSFNGITGFRLEVLRDARLPSGGPGRLANGNFVLTEFEVDHEPSPIPAPLAVVAGSVGMFFIMRRKNLRNTLGT